MLFNRTCYKKGLRAEFLARWYLRFHGFHIIRTRYVTGRCTGRAEIDIIARRGNLLVFVEVKGYADICGAWDAITPGQMRRLRAAAETYIARTHFRGDARFDVIIVSGRKIHWVRGAI